MLLIINIHKEVILHYCKSTPWAASKMKQGMKEDIGMHP